MKKLLSLILILLLNSCSSFPTGSYWQLTKPPLKYAGTHYWETEQKLQKVCRLYPHGTLIACTQRFEQDGIYYIHLGPLANECTINHEHAHGAGWMHDNRTPFVEDCGPPGYKYNG